MKQIVFVCLLLILSGCNTLSEKECINGDWYSIGVNDGAKGYSQERLNEHRESCAEYGRNVNHSAYAEGYQEGIKRFCTKANGYQQGSDGNEYHAICPAGLQAGFLEGYQAGLSNALDRAKQALRHLRWQQMNEKRESKNTSKGDKKKDRDKRDDGLRYEIENKQQEVEKLQRLLDQATYLRYQSNN